MPAPILIPSLITAGASLGSALIGRSAANNAEKEQQQATDQALGLQRDMYQQTRADLAPYRNVGSGAVGTLGALMGLPSGPSTDMAAPNQFVRGVPNDLVPAPTEPSASGHGPGRNAALERHAGTLADLGGHGNAIQARTQSSVQLMDDDGQLMTVPAAMADGLLARGARRV